MFFELFVIVTTIRLTHIIGGKRDRLKNNLTNGDHLWLFYETFPPEFLDSTAVTTTSDPAVTKLLGGAALFMPVENFHVDPETDGFLTSWKDQDIEFLERVRTYNPIPAGMPGFFNASNDYFTSLGPQSGAGFLYDAVMSIGLGACLASSMQNATTNSTVPPSIPSGVAHLAGIQSVTFLGASGRVVMNPAALYAGTRDSDSALYGVFNLRPSSGSTTTTSDSNKGNIEYILTDVLDNGDSSWTQLQDFVYADGSLIPPKDYQPDHNYLAPVVQAFMRSSNR